MRGRKQVCGKFGRTFGSRKKGPSRYELTLKSASGEMATVKVRSYGAIKVGNLMAIGGGTSGFRYSSCEVVGVRKISEDD